MGAVYVATKNGIDYALKMMLSFQTELDYKRFEREAQTLAKVDRHPNIVRIHSFGRCRGSPYMVLDLVAGGSLEDAIENCDKFPVEDALKIICKISDALGHIHANGIIHRDLKPANILIDDHDGRPLVMDFGLVKEIDAETLTRTNETVGTPKYMAPEQMMGKGIGPATDIWALGIVFYELLTKRVPFEGENALEICNKVVYQLPPNPSAIRRDIPDPVQQVILKCMARDPKNRYRSAGELREECERILAGQVTEVKRSGEVVEFRGRRGRRWLGVLSVALIFVGLLVFALPTFQIRQFEAKYKSRVLGAKKACKQTRTVYADCYALALLDQTGYLPENTKRTVFPKELGPSLKDMRKCLGESQGQASMDVKRKSMISDALVRELRWWNVLQRLLEKDKNSGSTPNRDERSIKVLWQAYQTVQKRNWARSEWTFRKLGLSHYHARLSKLGLILTFMARRNWLQAEQMLAELRGQHKWPLAKLEADLKLQLCLFYVLNANESKKAALVRLRVFVSGDAAKQDMLWSQLNNAILDAFSKLEGSSRTKIYLRLAELRGVELRLKLPKLDRKSLLGLARSFEKTGEYAQALIHYVKLKKMQRNAVIPGIFESRRLDQFALQYPKFNKDTQGMAEFVDTCARAGIYIQPSRALASRAAFEKHFERKLNSDPLDPIANFWYGIVLGLNERFATTLQQSKCLKAFRLALAGDRIKGNIRAVALLRRCQLNRYWTLQSLNPHKKSKRVEIAKLKARLKRDLEEALRNYPPRTYQVYYELYSVMGPSWSKAMDCLDRAESLLRELLQLAKDDALGRGRPEGQPQLAYSGNLDNEWRFIWRGRQRTYEYREEWELAIKSINRVIQYSIRIDNLLIEKGHLLCKVKKYKEAKALLVPFKNKYGPPRVGAQSRKRVFDDSYIELIEKVKEGTK
jgi:hypothetical protein